jgi:hypothetical protein
VPEQKIPLVRPIPAHEIINISIALDNYDDIFSDFDPRPYSKRELSLDFLREMERRHLEAGSTVEVRFLIPPSARDKTEEEFIIRRLRDHFSTEKKEVVAKVSRLQQTGIKLAVIGFALMIIGIVLVEAPSLKSVSPLSQTVIVASWFFLWTGLEKLFLENTQLQQDGEKFEKLRKASYLFEEFPEKPFAEKKPKEG